MSGYSWTSGARTVAWVVAIVAALYVVGTLMVGSDEEELAPRSSPTPSSQAEEPGWVSDLEGHLRYPGDVVSFERGLNLLVPWTEEISPEILVLASQDICAELDGSGDAVAARSRAIERGFEGADTALFVEQSVAFFCPQFDDLIPKM